MRPYPHCECPSDAEWYECDAADEGSREGSEDGDDY